MIRQSTLFAALCTFVWLGCGCSAHAALALVPAYGKFEASFSLPGQTGNPFDPQENDIDVVFRTPAGSHITAPAFWDGDVWRVRFCPERPGKYLLAVLRDGKPTATTGLTAREFECTPSADPGFIRRDPKITQAFVFDDGKAYYPLGCDVAWTDKNNVSYPTTFSHMRDARMNWARIWMTFWDGKALEWEAGKTDAPPIGQFTMDAAKEWDQIFDAAAKDGVYVQMTLQHHGQYTNVVNPNWPQNPYNVANGGFLKNPDDFFTDPRAKALTKAKYRYIVARWGYSTHIMGWELFNEVQNIQEANSHFQDVVNWHREMAAYIRSIDPYHHLITTSNSNPGTPLAGIGLDYDQVHIYSPDLIRAFQAVPLKGLSCPIFVGEFGGSGANGDTSIDDIHRALWAGMMTPMAGAPELWDWDHLSSQNWWPLFASARGFLDAYEIPELHDMDSIDVQATAQGPRADLSFAPPLGWAPTTSTDITVEPSGNLVGLGGASSFIQGKSHPDMMPAPLSFHMRCDSPCRFIVVFGQASRGGSHPTLSVDGALAAETDLPASNSDQPTDATLTVDVPSGSHIVALGNIGADWVTVSKITITGYAPPLAVLARSNGSSATFWAYARTGSQATLTHARLTVPGLAPGKYRVRLWDPASGSALPDVPARSSDGALTVDLPTITGDIAGAIEK